MNSMDHFNKQVFPPGVGQEFNTPLAAIVTDHSKTGDTVGLSVVVQYICKYPVHLVDFTMLCGVLAATISLRYN